MISHIRRCSLPPRQHPPTNLRDQDQCLLNINFSAVASGSGVRSTRGKKGSSRLRKQKSTIEKIQGKFISSIDRFKQSFHDFPYIYCPDVHEFEYRLKNSRILDILNLLSCYLALDIEYIIVINNNKITKPPRSLIVITKILAALKSYLGRSCFVVKNQSVSVVVELVSPSGRHRVWLV